MIALLTSLWLGILTSISPCPLATNIAAISFIGKDVTNPKKAILSGFLYVIGRVIAYVTLGIMIVSGLLSVPAIANFFQKYMNAFLGPLLILVGIILLGILKLNLNGGLSEGKVKTIAKKAGVFSAVILGILFALSFCPVSAALFFGSLISLAVEQNSKVILPIAYGIGTGVPVLIFAFIITFSINSLGKAYDNLRQFEFWARKITGLVFTLIGIYYTVTHTFNFGG